MEDTTGEDKLVHVLRPSFRPSQPLAESIENFIKPGKTLPRLSLYATKEVALDLIKYNNFVYTEDIATVRNKFKAESEPIYIGSQIHFRALGSRAVRMAFIPSLRSQNTFNKSLEVLDELPNVFPPFPIEPRFFMYIDIPFTHVVGPNEWGRSSDELRNVLAGRARSMYSVVTEDITGRDDTLHFVKKPEKSEGNDSPLVSPL